MKKLLLLIFVLLLSILSCNKDENDIVSSIDSTEQSNLESKENKSSIQSIVNSGPDINIIDFKVNESPNRIFTKGTRFDYEFKIKGDYTYATNGYHQIDLYVYDHRVSENNLLGIIKWNREDDYDLIFPNYTKKSMWVTALENYKTDPGYKFFLVAKYAGKTKTFSYTY